MERFGELLRTMRKNKRITLRELGEKVGLSISYLSDIEHGRRRPPKKNIISSMEKVLGITDGRLNKLAADVFHQAPREIARKVNVTPRLSEVLLRADRDLTDDEFNELMNLYENLRNKRR